MDVCLLLSQQTCLSIRCLRSILHSMCLKKNLNASRPSEHEKMSKRLGGIIIYGYMEPQKTNHDDFVTIGIENCDCFLGRQFGPYTFLHF